MRRRMLFLVALAGCADVPVAVDATVILEPREAELGEREGPHWSDGVVVPVGLPAVRMIYAVPSDGAPDPDHAAEMVRAVMDLQLWYREEMEGSTFAIASPMQHCALPGTEAEYLELTDHRWDRFYRIRDDVRDACADILYDRDFVSLVWVAIDDHCESRVLGAAGRPSETRAGYAIMELPFEYSYAAQCGSGSWDRGRWVGMIGHELGHGLGLHSPEKAHADCEEGDDRCLWSLMKRHYRWPETWLLDSERELLRQSEFVR